MTGSITTSSAPAANTRRVKPFGEPYESTTTGRRGRSVTALSIRFSAGSDWPGAGDDEQVVRGLVEPHPGVVDPVDEADDLDVLAARERALDVGLIDPRVENDERLDRIGHSPCLSTLRPGEKRGQRSRCRRRRRGADLRPQHEPELRVVGGVGELRSVLRVDAEDRVRATRRPAATRT